MNSSTNSRARGIGALAAGVLAAASLTLSVLAAPSVGADEGAGRTRTGPTGQTLTVSPADGLDPAGSTVRVQGSGFDTSMGIYLAVCVDNGPEIAPGPCIGGVAMEGGGGASYWISSNPPSYAIGLTVPYGEGGTFDKQLNVAAGDEAIDCFDGETTCVVATRADHLNTANRTADVKVPISFVGQDPIEDPVETTTTTAAPATTTTAVPATTAAPTTTVDQATSTTAAAEVQAATATNTAGSTTTAAANSSELAKTGTSSNLLAVVGAALVAMGLALRFSTARTHRLATVEAETDLDRRRG